MKNNPDIPTRPAKGALFQLTRIGVYFVIALLYLLCGFHKVCPTITSSEMAKAYNEETGELSIFSSIYFYPYGLIQPFAGLLADIFEPAYLIGISQLVAACGSIICGSSNTLLVGSIGRFLCGLGCGPTYVPITRCILNWFPIDYFPHFVGLLVALGGAGGIIASGPLQLFADAVGWRWAFYGIGIIGGVFALICIIFVRGNPTSYHYESVNPELTSVKTTEINWTQRFRVLWDNFLTVIKNPYFWLVVVNCVCVNGPWFAVSGMWASPFLQDVLEYSKQNAANAIISLSIGQIIGSLSLPPLSTALHTRKWMIFVTTILEGIVSFIFFLKTNDLPYGVIYFLFILFGMTTNCMTSVAYPFVREYFHPSVAATSVGCANIFTFLSSALYQEITKALMKKRGVIKNVNGNSGYTIQGYKNGLWLVCFISTILGAIAILITKDTSFANTHEKSDSEDQIEQKSDHEHDHEPEPEQTGEDLKEL